MRRIVITESFAYAHNGHRVVQYGKGEQDVQDDVAETAIKYGWAVTPEPAKPAKPVAPAPGAPPPAPAEESAEPTAAAEAPPPARGAEPAPAAPPAAQKRGTRGRR